MKTLLLDSNTIIEAPRILGITSKEYKLVTTPLVIDTIIASGNSSNISYNERITLIENAIRRKALAIVPSLINEIENIEYSITNYRLTRTEKNAIAYILYCKQNSEDIFLVTKNKTFQKVASNYKVKTIPLSELIELLDTIPKQQYESNDIFLQIEKYERKERNKIITGTAIGALLTFTAIKIYNNIAHILNSIDLWAAISLPIIASFTLYFIREKWRLPYGILEFSVGVFSVVVNFNLDHFDIMAIPLDSTFFIKIIGGIYIMVRGIDNVMIALKDTRFGVLVKNTLTKT